jgi:hypothetical protein
MRLTKSTAINFILSSCGAWTRIFTPYSSLLRLLLLYHLLTLNNSVGALRSRRSCAPIVGFAFRPPYIKQLDVKRLGYCHRVNCPMHQFPTKGCAKEYLGKYRCHHDICKSHAAGGSSTSGEDGDESIVLLFYEDVDRL